MKSAWGEWKKIEEKTEHTKPTVYKVRLVRKGNPVLINRFLGKDEGGILFIGSTENMERRRDQFERGLERIHGHSGANLLHLLRENAGFKLEIDRLEYRFKRMSKKRIKVGEEMLIKEYVRKYGEVPPLNSAIPNKRGSWE